jgi:hypothetical protein
VPKSPSTTLPVTSSPLIVPLNSSIIGIGSVIETFQEISLPLTVPSALATPPLMANLRGRSSAAEITMNCKVTKVFYLGDEGDITCQVTFDEKKRRCSSCRSLTSPLIAGSLLRAR